MVKKKVDPKYEVHDTSIKVEKFKVHQNETPMNQTMTDDGQVIYTPTDPFCAVKVKGYFDDGHGYSGYEVMAKRYEKDGLFQWVRGKKWELVGYIKCGKPTWLIRSQWISDMLGILIEDIRNYEQIMKQRMQEV